MCVCVLPFQLQLEDIELSETPDPQPAAEIFEKLQDNAADRPEELSKVVSGTNEIDDPKCQIIAAKCQSSLLDEDKNRTRKIVIEA